MEDHCNYFNFKNNKNHSGGESSPQSDVDSSGGNVSNNATSFDIREQDRLLPIANVGRIMKQKLPGNAKISKEAKQTMQECVSEFISFVTGEASHRCQKEKRKTINGDDILGAISSLGFDDYAEPLTIYLDRYRQCEGDNLSLSKYPPPSSSMDRDRSASSNFAAK